MHIKNKKGQSTVEYILLVTAVVAVMIAFVTSTKTGGFQATLNSALGTASEDIGTGMGALSRSHAPGTTVVASGDENQIFVNVDGNLPK